LVSHNPLAIATTSTRWFGVAGLSSTVDSIQESIMGSASAVGSDAYMDSIPDSTVGSSSTEGGGKGSVAAGSLADRREAPTGAFRIKLACG
jgi:hypothetical protein